MEYKYLLRVCPKQQKRSGTCCVITNVGSCETHRQVETVASEQELHEKLTHFTAETFL